MTYEKNFPCAANPEGALASCAQNLAAGGFTVTEQQPTRITLRGKPGFAQRLQSQPAISTIVVTAYARELHLRAEFAGLSGMLLLLLLAVMSIDLTITGIVVAVLPQPLIGLIVGVSVVLPWPFILYFLNRAMKRGAMAYLDAVLERACASTRT